MEIRCGRVIKNGGNDQSECPLWAKPIDLTCTKFHNICPRRLCHSTKDIFLIKRHLLSRAPNQNMITVSMTSTREIRHVLGSFVAAIPSLQWRLFYGGAGSA
ncbi:hypothetical protein GDO81_023629 [Engystomops pustulosus]|uniref:Uncharacterized protein n=1 Tax=Engystomops pustulosus TaxID=76066 RepID=A0AAV6Z952_ENGPU|nr:hypothetical protein GDO81_023629 [Engystomops pustulosus]